MNELIGKWGIPLKKRKGLVAAPLARTRARPFANIRVAMNKTARSELKEQWPLSMLPQFAARLAKGSVCGEG
jgi:hypothetical protein